MQWQLTTSPLREPVSLEQIKRHLRVYDEENDSLLSGYLRAARIWCENYAGRAFLWQQYQAKLDYFGDEIILPMPPPVAVSSIAYIDSDGASQTLDADIYELDKYSEPGRIRLAYNQSWPSVRGHFQDITITYIAGYAATFTRSSSKLVVPGHKFTVNDFVGVYNIGGALPAGLSAATDYYVKTVTGDSIELALTEGGTAVTLSDAGTGTHYIDTLPANYKNAILLRLTELWSNRGDQPFETSRSIRDLLSQGRITPI